MLESLFRTNSSPQIDIGSIGWEDEADYFFTGDDSNDGHTMVRVQLFRGRDNTKPLNPDRAQGFKLLCHIPGGGFRIPPKDTRCYVAIPHGMENLPGAGIILATVEKSPTEQFSDTRVKMDYGANYDLVIKARSITITDYNDNYVSIGSNPGVRLADSAGNLFQVKGGLTGLATSKINLVVGSTGAPASSGLFLSSSAAAMTAGSTMVKLNGTTQMGTWISASISLAAGNIGLGTGASPATPACIAPMLPSTTVFLQP